MERRMGMGMKLVLERVKVVVGDIADDTLTLGWGWF